MADQAKTHRGSFVKIMTEFWLGDPRRTGLSRAHSGDLVYFLQQVMVQGREDVLLLPSIHQQLARDWRVKRRTVDRSLAALSSGPNPLIKVIDAQRIWVCGYSKVVTNPRTGRSAVREYIPPPTDVDVDVEVDVEEEVDKDQDVEGEAVGPPKEVEDTTTAEAPATTSSSSGWVSRALAVLKRLTDGWPGKVHQKPKVILMVPSRAKEVLACAKWIEDHPEGLGSRWSVLCERLKKGWNVPAEYIQWANEQLRE